MVLSADWYVFTILSDCLPRLGICMVCEVIWSLWGCSVVVLYFSRVVMRVARVLL
jgi:uncharacterized membrane protein